MRLTNDELKEIEKKYNVSRLYSWSRINAFISSPYEYFLHYIKDIQPDRPEGAYTILGGACHTILEDYYSNNLKQEDLLDKFKDRWNQHIITEKVLFDRKNRSKNENIGNKYKTNIEHFFMNHIKLSSNIELEKFLSAKLDSYVFQGYADAILKDEDGTFTIIDWKTSTKYSEKDLDDHSGQLVLYAISLMQQGIPLEKIKCAFCFLKYCTVGYGEDCNLKYKDIERCSVNSVTDLKELKDCFVYVNLTAELINKWTTFFINTVQQIENLENKYAETLDERLFYDSEESVQKNYYYFLNLCRYSAKLHKPFKLYMDKNFNKS